MSTPPVVYRIRHATTDDLDACMRLRIHAEHWLAANGIEQWTDREKGADSIRTNIEDGSMFVVCTGDGTVAACLALNGADLDFWRPNEAVQPALYLYKLIIRSDRRSTGLGDLLMDWACRRAHEAGAWWLRMDCWRTNTALQDYYLKRGFTHVDTREHPDRQSGWLAQRDVTTRTTNPDEAAVMLVDDANPARPAALPVDNGDRYDPTGEAAIYQHASNLTEHMKLGAHAPVSPSAYDDALGAAARELENQARNVRQAGGMYHRVFATNR